MKNLIFTLAFMLIGTFAFANVKNTKTVPFKTIEKSAKKQVLAKLAAIHVKLSCGVEYDITNFSGTITQLLNSVISMNNSVCGTKIQTLEVQAAE